MADFEMAEWFPKAWQEVNDKFGTERANLIGQMDNLLGELICDLEDVGVHMRDSLDDYRAMLEEVTTSEEATKRAKAVAFILFEITKYKREG